MIHALCPVTDKVRAVIQGALANNRSAQYILGLTLTTGDRLPHDDAAGVAWIVRAAEAGEPGAGRVTAMSMRC